MSVRNVYENGYINDSQGEMRLATPLRLHSWLEAHDSFTVKTSVGKFTVRKESRKRGHGYWAMYKKVQGKLRKRYLGMSHEVTQQLIKDAVKAILEDAPDVETKSEVKVTQPTEAIDAYLAQSKLFETGRDYRAVKRCRDWIESQGL